MDMTTTEDGRVVQDPIWRQAAIDVVEAFQYGDIINWEWLREHLELTDEEAFVGTFDDFKGLAFDRLNKVESLKKVLLTEHRRHLVSEYGLGYRIVEPRLQADEAMQQLTADIQRCGKRAKAILENVETSGLNDAEVRRLDEARLKVAFFQQSTDRQLTDMRPPKVGKDRRTRGSPSPSRDLQVPQMAH